MVLEVCSLGFIGTFFVVVLEACLLGFIGTFFVVVLEACLLGFIGASLSEPHTSVTAFAEVVCMSVCTVCSYIP